MVAYEFLTEVTKNRMLVIPATTAPALHPGVQVRVILLVEDDDSYNGNNGNDSEQQFDLNQFAEFPLLPADEFEKQFHAALTEAGYDTEEKITELVRSVRREIAIEKGRLPKPLPIKEVHE